MQIDISSIARKIPFFSILMLINLLLFWACKKELTQAEIIVNECIVAHGGENFNQINIGFDFRDKHYKLQKNGKDYVYERIAKDTAGVVTKDVFTNTKFERTLAGKAVPLADSMVQKYKNSINSVIYFMLLPQPLNDAAVQKTYLGQGTIGGQKYHKIEVRFNAENGGKDHEDIYVYWINQKTKTMDYFAYSYKVDGGGIRFREAIKAETIAGIRYQNYINYAPIDTTYSLQNLDKAFTEGKLREFSRIENNNIIASQLVK